MSTVETLGRPLARLFAMTDPVWRRHANPWSVWTRVAILPAATLLVDWAPMLGAWLWPLAGALVLWIWLNPRVFPARAPNDGWSWRAVMGERRWVRGDGAPEDFNRRAHVANWAAIPFATLWLIGVLIGHDLAMWTGVGGVIASKLWFLDVMAKMHRAAVPDPARERLEG